MAMKRCRPQQIVHLPRQTEVGIANGRRTAQACKEAEITEQTYYRTGLAERCSRLFSTAFTIPVGRVTYAVGRKSC
jgi:hypothetical protein